MKEASSVKEQMNNTLVVIYKVSITFIKHNYIYYSSLMYYSYYFILLKNLK